MQETAKGRSITRQKVRGKSDRNAAKMKTAAKAARNKSALRLNVASAHKKNMRLNIDYTHKNNVRTEIYYIHTHNTA